MLEPVTDRSREPGLVLQVSVIVVNWNRRDFLRAALGSLCRQTGLALKPEIIVVDNGSSDGSAAMVREAFPEARLIQNNRNRGFCAANNQGIQAAQGSLIALLNNDAVAGPGWLAALTSVFVENSSVGMAASKILVYSSPRHIDKAGHLLWPDGQNRGRGTGEIDCGQYDRMQEVLWPDGCAAMYRKSMLDRIGGFDEDFFAYGDDAELGLRARIAGWKCLYQPSAVVLHHRAKTLGLANPQRVTLIERNRVLLAAKLFPLRLLIRNPYFYLRRLIAGFFSSLAGAGEAALFPGWRGRFVLAWALLAGDIAAMALIPRMLRKRHSAVKVIRTLSPSEIEALILGNCIPLADLSTRTAHFG